MASRRVGTAGHTASLSPRTPIAVGSIGTLLILAGSAGAGWVGPGSTVRRWWLVEWPRSTELLQSLSSYAVILGGLLLIGGWIRLGTTLRRNRDGRLRAVLTAALVWAVPLAVAVPLYSRDLFAYVGQGRLVLNGINPYLNGIAAERGWYAIGVDPMWANTKTPYGPVFIWMEKVVVGAAGDSPVIAVATFRVLAILGVLAMAWYAYRIAVVRGTDPVTVLWFVAASPVTMFNFVVGGHNDALMLALILAAVYYALVRHPIVGVVLVTAAVGVKPIAVIALPVIGLIWAAGRTRASTPARATKPEGDAAPRRDLRTVIIYWAISAAISVALLAAIGFAVNVGFGWIAALTTPGSVAHWYAPVNWVSSFLGWITRLLGFDGNLVKSVIKGLALAVMAVIVAWVMLTPRRIDPLLRLAIAFAAAVLLSPFIHPWYAAWVIVLFAVAGLRAGTPVQLLTAASVFFAWVSVAEGTDTTRTVGGSVWFTVIRTVLTVGGILALAAYFLREHALPPRMLLHRARTLWSERRALAADTSS